MIYEFKCLEHGGFEVEQYYYDEHKANCPVCGTLAQRVFHPVFYYYVNPRPLFHKDGTYQEV